MHAIPKHVLLFGNVRPLWSIGPDEIFFLKKQRRTNKSRDRDSLKCSQWSVKIKK